MKRIRIGLVLALFSLPVAQYGFFENHIFGGRAVGNGGAVAGIADVYGVMYNPAGLAEVKGVRVSASVSPVYVSEVMAYYFNASYDLGFGTLGAGLCQVGADGVLTERVLRLGMGFDLGPMLGIDPKGVLKSLRAGAMLKLLSASIEGYEANPSEGFTASKSAFSAAVGVQAVLFDKDFTFGVYADNLIPSSFAFTTKGSDTLGMELRFGLSWLLNQYFRVTMDYAIDNASGVKPALGGVYLGTETYFYDILTLRTGFSEGNLTIGIGIETGYAQLNIGMRLNETLSTYYQIDMIFKL